MMSYIKIIILLFTIIATCSNAFVSKSVVSKKVISSSNGGVGNISSSRHSHSVAYRISKPTLSTSLSSQLSMATATPTAPAPTKKKEKEEEVETEKAKDRGWLVRLFNDPMNKREFVARCLMEVCGLDDGMAFNVMMLAHQNGVSVIGNYHHEMAELYKVRLLEEGLLVDMVPADDEE